MKSINKILVFSLCMLGIVACKDGESSVYDSSTSVSVVKSDVIFPAATSSGTVEVTCPTAITATTNCDWCKATVNGKTVNVTVDENDDLNGRAVPLVIKSAYGDSTVVTVQQSGLIFELSAGSSIVKDDAAASLAYSVKHNVDINYIPTADWITVTPTSDSLKINLAANTTGHLRSAYLKYQAGASVDSIKITQCDFDKDIAGQYYFAYTNSKGKTTYFASQLTKDSLFIPSLSLAIATSYEASTATLSMKCGQFIGMYSVYYLYLMFMDAEGNYWTGYSNTSSAATATFKYDDENGTYAEFGGYFGEHAIASFLFEAFKDSTMSSANNAGSLVVMNYPFLQKMDASGAKAKTASFSKGELLNLKK